MTLIQRLPHPRSVLFGLVLLAGLSAVGCNGTYPGPVQGYVHLNGQPVTAGTVVFTDQYTGAAYSTPIQPNGTYSFASLTPSRYQVTLFNPQAPLSGVIPYRYDNIATSGLSLEGVGESAAGDGTVQTYNIDLSK